MWRKKFEGGQQTENDTILESQKKNKQVITIEMRCHFKFVSKRNPKREIQVVC